MARTKPPVSEWIAVERKRAGWKVDELSRRLVEAGYPAEVSTIRVWEAGRSPRQETIEALERLFGSAAPRDRDQGGDNSALISEQTAVLRELVEEVRLSRLVSERSAVVLAELLGSLAQGRLPLVETPGASGARVE